MLVPDSWTGYAKSLVSPKYMPLGVKVALIVGSVLLLINHGAAMVSGQMTRGRWLSAALTYGVPYLVNVHGQYMGQRKKRR